MPNNKIINLQLLKKMLNSGTINVMKNVDYINELNVFPVPDGDTGTNLKITLNNALIDIEKNETTDLCEFGTIYSKALLMNARGNSGVIMSQIIKGIVSIFPLLLNNEITIKQFQEALIAAKSFAYQAVSKPVEGTILTVIRLTSDKLITKKFNTIEDLFIAICDEAKNAVELTTDMLKVLKDAGVVDSGGYGLYCFFEGMKYAILNKEVPISEENEKHIIPQIGNHEIEEGFGYCSEVILKLNEVFVSNDKENKKKFDFLKFKEYLERIGNSLVCIQDDDIVKVHVHTLEPGKLLNFSQKYGELLKIKIENMTLQYQAKKQKELKNFDRSNLTNNISLILTAPSTKITGILENHYGFSNVINREINKMPSVKDLLSEIHKTNSKKVIIVIDDPNIFLAAAESKKIVEKYIQVHILKCENILQTLGAGLEFSTSRSALKNMIRLRKWVKDSLTAQISKATRDSKSGELIIKKDDYIAISKKTIFLANKSETKVLKQTTEMLIKESKNPDILIVFYNNDENLAKLLKIEKVINDKYNIFCEFIKGEQKVYDYIIGVQ